LVQPNVVTDVPICLELTFGQMQNVAKLVGAIHFSHAKFLFANFIPEPLAGLNGSVQMT
jgi:hypothetical protein